jgi:uncharacterized protein YjbJ (UPF0337 family)
MNELNVKGNWNEKKGQLKQQYAKLTDNDLKFAEVKEEANYCQLGLTIM